MQPHEALGEGRRERTGRFCARSSRQGQGKRVLVRGLPCFWPFQSSVSPVSVAPCESHPTVKWPEFSSRCFALWARPPSRLLRVTLEPGFLDQHPWWDGTMLDGICSLAQPCTMGQAPEVMPCCPLTCSSPTSAWNPT